jgi:DNA-binding YbaB/EbfC family protein
MSDEGFDINALLNQAMAMQQQMAEAQEQAASQSVEGQAGGGAVRVTMTGGGEVTRVSIAPAAVDPADVEMLEDLVLAAFHDAQAKVEEIRRTAIGEIGGLGGLLGSG